MVANVWRQIAIRLVVDQIVVVQVFVPALLVGQIASNAVS